MRQHTCAGTVSVVVCLLIFAGCAHPNGADDPFDQRLTGTWSNKVHDIKQKTFVIRSDGSFTASINPGLGGRGTVTGRLVADKGEYIMTGMAENAGTDWKNAVGTFNGTYVQMVFSGPDAFDLKCKGNNVVEQFFGALFYREAPGIIFDYRGDNVNAGNTGNTGNNGPGDAANPGGNGTNPGDGKPASGYSLIGSWSNGKTGVSEKTFTIAGDGISFTVSLDPGLGGRGTVTGKLVAEEDNHILQDMKEITGKPFWGKLVGAYDKTAIQIVFSGKDAFDLKCAKNKIVETMFGGAFHRVLTN
jgi:hypothetical protein